MDIKYMSMETIILLKNSLEKRRKKLWKKQEDIKLFLADEQNLNRVKDEYFKKHFEAYRDSIWGELMIIENKLLVIQRRK